MKRCRRCGCDVTDKHSLVDELCDDCYDDSIIEGEIK